MEQLESLQRVNRQQRLAEWSRRVEACRNSGLTVVQWCQEHGIAVSTYFSWQKKVFQALTEVQEMTFAEVPVLEYSQPSGHVAASVEVNGIQIQVYLREQWPYLVRYLEDGRLELSNTPAGAQSSAVIYSLIETAKKNDLDPYRYLVWLLHNAPERSQKDEAWPEFFLPVNAPKECRILKSN